MPCGRNKRLPCFSVALSALFSLRQRVPNFSKVPLICLAGGKSGGQPGSYKGTGA